MKQIKQRLHEFGSQGPSAPRDKTRGHLYPDGENLRPAREGSVDYLSTPCIVHLEREFLRRIRQGLLRRGGGRKRGGVVAAVVFAVLVVMVVVVVVEVVMVMYR